MGRGTLAARLLAWLVAVPGCAAVAENDLPERFTPREEGADRLTLGRLAVRAGVPEPDVRT